MPSCASAHPGLESRSSPAPQLWQQHVLAWQEPLPPGLAVQTPIILEEAISSRSLAAPLPDTNILQLL